jgi:hypothetical protein
MEQQRTLLAWLFCTAKTYLHLAVDQGLCLSQNSNEGVEIG